MSGAGTAGGLERRYRRLLAWYPRDHHAEHADEMLGVLMAGAREGQTRPGADESANLVAGAVRIRLRRAAGSLGGPCWRDALAVVSVLAPVLLLALSLEQAVPPYLHGLPLYRPGTGAIAAQGDLYLLAGWLAVTVLVLLRRRRAAAVAAAVTVAAQALRFAVHVRTGWWFAGAPYAPVQMFLGVLTLAVILCSDGPRRGLAVLGRRRSGPLAGGVLALAAAHALWLGYFPESTRVVSQLTEFALTGVAMPAAVGVMALRSPIGRRVMVLAGPAASPLGVFFLARILVTPGPPPGPDGLMWVLYLVLAIVAAALAVAARMVPGGAGPAAARPGA